MDFKDTELFKVYVVLFFKNIVGSMFHIFTAVYLYVNGFPILLIGLFYILSSVIVVLGLFLLGGGHFHLKTKKSLNIGLTLFIISSILMYFLPTNSHLLFVASILFGFQIVFFWVPLHTTFAYESKGCVIGREASIYMILQKTGDILGPLIASLIILFWKFEFIYPVGVVFILLAMISARTLKANFNIHKIDFKKSFSRFDKGVSLALAGEGINIRLLTFTLPLFMFLVVGSAALVGWVIAGAIALGFVSILIVGAVSDYKRKYEKKFFKIGVTGSSISWILRIFAFNFWSLLILEYLDNLASSARTVPFVAYYYNKARNSHHVIEYTIIREMIKHSSMVIGLIPITLIMMFFPIQYAFIIGAIVVYLEIFMIKKPQKLFFHHQMHPHK